MDKKAIFKFMDDHKQDFEHISDCIWDYAEIGYEETRSAGLQMDCLKEKGFRIVNPVGGIDTAFIAEYGSGSPVIAILGEYDALHGLSQKADMAEEKPIEGQLTGHGCGHHLLGTAAMEAVCAVKYLMEHENLKGTIRYYGCPAEEGGVGKVYMIRAGAFKDVDAALSWHPGAKTGLMGRALACVLVNYSFRGVASHAASAPDRGRSALDAAELMNVGVQFLREHIPDECRIHYAFLNAGGPRPNVVQANADLRYVIRASTSDGAKSLYDRITDIAKGAALMTGTELSVSRVVNAYSDIIPNDALAGVVGSAMKELYPLGFTPEEHEYAKRFNEAVKGSEAGYIDSYDLSEKGMSTGTTDFGDVSWVVPSAGFSAACYAASTVAHSWIWTAQGKSSGAKKGMHMAAKILYSCAHDLLYDNGLVEQAKKDFAKALGGRVYKSLQPEDSRPAPIK